jgi:hypothetical protein
LELENNVEEVTIKLRRDTAEALLTIIKEAGMDAQRRQKLTNSGSDTTLWHVRQVVAALEVAGIVS